MKKWLLPIILIGALILWGISQNNKMIDMKGKGSIDWANVETAYQRRMDLYDNLVSVVKGAANHEKTTLEAVIKARAEATQVKIDPSNMTPEKMAAFQKAQSGLAGAFNKLMMVHENYPDLKANQNFLEFQSQMEGTENRINTARTRYNESAGAYNIFISKFPSSLVAKVAGFKGMELFKGEAGSAKAPKIDLIN